MSRSQEARRRGAPTTPARELPHPGQPAPPARGVLQHGRALGRRVRAPQQDPQRGGERAGAAWRAARSCTCWSLRGGAPTHVLSCRTCTRVRPAGPVLVWRHHRVLQPGWPRARPVGVRGAGHPPRQLRPAAVRHAPLQLQVFNVTRAPPRAACRCKACVVHSATLHLDDRGVGTRTTRNVRKNKSVWGRPSHSAHVPRTSWRGDTQRQGAFERLVPICAGAPPAPQHPANAKLPAAPTLQAMRAAERGPCACGGLERSPHGREPTANKKSAVRAVRCVASTAADTMNAVSEVCVGRAVGRREQSPGGTGRAYKKSGVASPSAVLPLPAQHASGSFVLHACARTGTRPGRQAAGAAHARSSHDRRTAHSDREGSTAPPCALEPPNPLQSRPPAARASQATPARSRWPAESSPSVRLLHQPLCWAG